MSSADGNDIPHDHHGETYTGNPRDQDGQPPDEGDPNETRDTDLLDESGLQGEDKNDEVEGQATLDPEQKQLPSEAPTDALPSSKESSDSAATTESTGSKAGARRGRRNKKHKDEDGVHRVTFTVTIAKAIPSGEDEGPKVDDLMKRKKRIVEAPKASGYYHCQYYLLPEDEDPTKTDVVTFGMAAKVYTESDSKVLKTWQENDQTWIAWSHSHSVKVTKELLLKLFDHTLQLRIWESRDKVSARARFDRPKAFRLPQAKPGEDADDVGGVKSLVLKHSRSYISLQPKKSFSERPVPQNGPAELADIKDFGKTDLKGRPILPRPVSSSPEHGSKTPEELLRLTEAKSAPHSGPSSARQTPVLKNRDSPSRSPNKDTVQPVKTYNYLGKLAGIPSPELQRSISRPRERGSRRASIKPIDSQDEKRERQGSGQGGGKSPSTDKKAPSPVSKRSLKDSPQQKEAKRKSQKMEQEAAALAAHIKEHGNACIPIRMKLLFSGLRSVTNRLDKPVSGIEDVFITVALDGPLMSEEVHRGLNPMVLKVASCSDLPETPLTQVELGTRCEPVHAEYKLHSLPVHQSNKKSRTGGSIYWEDINVVLLGTIPQGELLEYLRGPPLEVHLHDRDRKPDDVKSRPLLFGADMEDDKISNVGMVTGKRTIHNPFEVDDKPWDPYGVAKFDLSPLLLGQRVLFLTSPVHNCPIPDQLGRYGNGERLIGVQNAVDGPKDEPLPAGHYIDAGTQLKIKVEVAYPLTTPSMVQSKPLLATPPETPFSRIIYMFEYKNAGFLHPLLQLVTQINAKALCLGALPEHIIQAALSTYKLSPVQQQSHTLDIVTGFQIMDGDIHIFVLEGLRDQAIRLIWESLPQPKKQDGIVFEVLYNSDFVFRERKYAALDVDLCRVKLHQPLSAILRQPLLYVRDMVPPPCLEALVKLDQLVDQKRLRDVTKNDLFPSAESIISLSREFGVPLTTADFEDLRESRNSSVGNEDDGGNTVTANEEYQRRNRPLQPLDIYNSGYMEHLADKEFFGQQHDYIKKNITEVGIISSQNEAQRERPNKVVIETTDGIAHNYSTQTLNSTEQTKEALRRHLAQQPDKRFTYCHEYNSASVVPVNVEASKKEEELVSIARHKTEEGFVYPGVDSAMESNAHPRRPDQARIDELKQYWRENILHANTLNPTLEERKGYRWQDRNRDLNLLKRPSPSGLAPIPPITIHAAGETLQAEQRAEKERESKAWQSRLVVDDALMHFHRLTTGTELKDQGFHSSNQLDRLSGLLKDRPQKYSLRQANFQRIPALGVVQNPGVDTEAEIEGAVTLYREDVKQRERNCGFVPGDHDQVGLLMDKNRVPIRSMEHQHFRDLKGDDFRLYHKEQNALHKPHLKPITHDELTNNNLFNRIPTRPPEKNTPKKGPGNVCFRQPPPGIRPAPIQTEFYYPDREMYWKSPCDREATNRKAVLL